MVASREQFRENGVKPVFYQRYNLSEIDKQILPEWTKSLLDRAYPGKLDGTAFQLIENKLMCLGRHGSDVIIVWGVEADKELDYLQEKSHLHSKAEIADGHTKLKVRTTTNNSGSGTSFEDLIQA